ncbi:toll/interleukin-1 receptor domain-containing protein [Flexithrix dorotheae]|uniref:toll/interleukin-1 receptor domain-containing protein n=1 Tax=Flexithrix dorotheae TaxID=70993 RepID=UPI00036E831F|nr:toll/interleukin-1 receptor domain-containing protein [Flexithrix dorotheae]
MKVFISYSWDSEAHKSWVLHLANSLIQNGIDVLLDQYELRLGRNLNHFMESSIIEADKIITVFTENYKLKSETRDGGIGYEYSMISNELYKSQINNTKVIPILRAGSPELSIPIFMSSFLWLDMRDDSQFESALENLIREIYGELQLKKPALGNKPILSSTVQTGNFSGFNWKNKAPKYIESFDFDNLQNELFKDFNDEIWIGKKQGGLFELQNDNEENAVKYHHINYNNENMADYATSVEVKLIKGQIAKSSCGLILCFNKASKTYYSFTISNTRQCNFWLKTNEGYKPILSERTKLIEPNDFNKLGCIINKGKIHLFINDNLFRVVDENTLKMGDAGIIAMSLGQFAFDNLSFFAK